MKRLIDTKGHCYMWSVKKKVWYRGPHNGARWCRVTSKAILLENTLRVDQDLTNATKEEKCALAAESQDEVLPLQKQLI